MKNFRFSVFVLFFAIIGLFVQPVSGLTPARDNTGDWSGTWQINVEDYCTFSGTININFQQNNNAITGNYNYKVTNIQNLNPDLGIDCKLDPFSGYTTGTVSSSSITLSFDSWTMKGSFTSDLMSLSMSDSGINASIKLSRTSSPTSGTGEQEEEEHEQTVDAYYEEYKKDAIRSLNDGNFNKAIIHFEKIIGLVPENYFGWYGKGIALSALGKYTQSVTNLNEAIERNPNKVDIWKAAGDAYYKLKDCNKSYSYYSKALDIDPNNSGLKTYQSLAQKCAQLEVKPQPIQPVEPVTTDTDGDGIMDDVDQCPKSKETKNLFEDKDGCPDVPPIRSYNIKPGERYINPEQVKVTALGWVIGKGSDTMSETMEYISPNDVKMKCYERCSDEHMKSLEGIAIKNFGGGFEKSTGDIVDSVLPGPVKAVKGLMTSIGKHSKFLIKTLPEHMSETEAQTWHVIFTGQLAVLDTKTKFFIETDDKGTFVYVLEDHVNVFYKDPKRPIKISANEIAFATDEEFKKGTFMPDRLTPWWDGPSKEIEINFEEEPKRKVPDWIKNNARWWADGQVDDDTFAQGIGFLIKEKIIGISELPEQASVAEENVPDWIKNNARWWVDGMISEDDFIKGVKFLVEKGIVQVK